MAVIVTVHFLLFLDDQSGDQVVPARISRTDVVLPDYFERLRSSHVVRTKVGARVVGKGAEKLGTEPVPSIVADHSSLPLKDAGREMVSESWSISGDLGGDSFVPNGAGKEAVVRSRIILLNYTRREVVAFRPFPRNFPLIVINLYTK